MMIAPESWSLEAPLVWQVSGKLKNAIHICNAIWKKLQYNAILVSAENGSDIDTKIQPCFQFPRLIPNFGHTLNLIGSFISL